MSEHGALRRAAEWVRKRIVLETVDPEDATGFVIPCNPHRTATYRGGAEYDYACGACGSLICIGVQAGMFPSFVFSCACGVLNRVP
jgi:hypothetical protein